MRPERLGTDSPLGPLPCALKGLSQDQLIEMLLGLTKIHPELEQELRESLPAPDLRPMEDQLAYLRKNIFKSLPTSRLTSKYDSPAYNRANTHVLSFKVRVNVVIHYFVFKMCAFFSQCYNYKTHAFTVAYSIEIIV
jgi:hypothetical protein